MSRAESGETSALAEQEGSVPADIRPVPGSPWFMVAKVDSAEILAEARYHVVQHWRRRHRHGHGGACGA